MPEVCAHTNTIRVLAYVKCTRCGEVWAQPGHGYDPNCPDCEFETHRCGRCGEQLDHTERHRCMIALRR